jgi:hypothetical protein
MVFAKHTFKQKKKPLTKTWQTKQGLNSFAQFWPDQVDPKILVWP